MGECSESVKGSKVGSGADRYEHACAQHGPTSLSGVKGCMNTHTYRDKVTDKMHYGTVETKIYGNHMWSAATTPIT